MAAMSDRLPEDYRIPDDDARLLAECDVTCFVASGPGGQHRNRTMSAVRLRHRPSGIVVIGRRRRSQHRNRADALERLRHRLEDLQRVPVKRVATRPHRAARERRIRAKQRQSRIKKLRRRVRDED